jgi:hypothetical protein
MVRFISFLLLAASAEGFQVPQSNARSLRPNDAVAVGTDFVKQTTETGTMIDLNGIVFSVSSS